MTYLMPNNLVLSNLTGWRDTPKNEKPLSLSSKFDHLTLSACFSSFLSSLSPYCLDSATKFGALGIICSACALSSLSQIF